MCRAMELKLHKFFTSESDGGDWSSSCQISGSEGNAMKITVFCGVILYSLVHYYQYFRGICCFHLRSHCFNNLYSNILTLSTELLYTALQIITDKLLCIHSEDEGSRFP
jgi:hypothetical protein